MKRRLEIAVSQFKCLLHDLYSPRLSPRVHVATYYILGPSIIFMGIPLGPKYIRYLRGPFVTVPRGMATPEGRQCV